MESINLLDCTLRDGGHLVKGVFGEEVIKSVIKKLIEAKIDIIEVGFITDETYGTDTTRFHTLADVKRILPKNKGSSKYSLMANVVDVSNFEPYDGTIDFIRLAFKRHLLAWGLEAGKILMDKGYKVSINMVNCNTYTDKEYISAIEKINELHPHSLSIVDTFGVLRKGDLSRFYHIVENNLLKDISIGIHLHENLGLSYTLAQHFLEIKYPARQVVIDCSLYGMGRAPGNLCTELIMDHLNANNEKMYNTEPVLDAIDNYIMPIKNTHPWGYSIPYALSGKYGLHRTYAEYLMNKGRLKTKDIQRILGSIDRSEAELFNEAYVERLYKDYLNVDFDDSEYIKRLRQVTSNHKILVISPGSTINEYAEEISRNINEESLYVISVNFKPDFPTNLVFCTNMKRYDDIMTDSFNLPIAITSNFLQEQVKYEYMLSYNNLAYQNEVYCDDSTLMLLNLLKTIGCGEVYICGFDGEQDGEMKFFSTNFQNKQRPGDNGRKILSSLSKNFSNISIHFLTPSVYQNYNSEVKK